jgi:hypothetical protein
MGTPKKRSMPATKAGLYDKLIATHPEIQRKGAANPYTSLNGHMFTILHDSRSLAIRLPQVEREEFLKKYKTTLFKAYGTIMKEYVAVPLLGKNERTAKISRIKLPIRQDIKAQTNQEEILIGEAGRDLSILDL